MLLSGEIAAVWLGAWIYRRLEGGELWWRMADWTEEGAVLLCGCAHKSISYHSFCRWYYYSCFFQCFNELNFELNSILRCISDWFQNNQLVLNLNKTHITKFASSKLPTYQLNTVYKNWILSVAENIRFLGMHRNCNLTWKSHMHDLIKNWGRLASFWETSL